jgi:hypothetical protein
VLHATDEAPERLDAAARCSAMDTMISPPVVVRRHDPVHGAISAVLGVVTTLLGLAVLAWLILFVTKGRFLKPTFEKYASRYADRPVGVAGRRTEPRQPGMGARPAAVHRAADRYRDQHARPDLRTPARPVP